MGEPVKIAALARQMIELSGLRPDVDIEIEYVGLRPGEKPFEELKCQGENFRPTRHPRIMSFIHQPESFARVQSALARLEEEMYSLQIAEVRNRIRLLVPEYVPYSPWADPDGVECRSPGGQAVQAGTFKLVSPRFVEVTPTVMAEA